MRKYNPAEVSIIISGIPISGYADGTFITVERDEDSFTKQVGTDGEVTRSKSNNKTGTATLILMQTSASNLALSALLAVDELTGNGVGPFLMKDNSGNSIYAGQNCWLRKYPSSEFGREATGREWAVDIDKLDVLEGGN